MNITFHFDPVSSRSTNNNTPCKGAASSIPNAASSNIGYNHKTQPNSLCHRVFTVIKKGFHWVKSILLMILGWFKCNTSSKPNTFAIDGIAALQDYIPQESEHFSQHAIKRQIFISQLENLPPETFARFMGKHPKLNFYFGNEIYQLENVFYTFNQPTEIAINRFKTAFLEIVKKALNHPNFIIQVSPDTSFRNDKPEEPSKDLLALADHRSNTLDFIKQLQRSFVASSSSIQDHTLPLEKLSYRMDVVARRNPANRQSIRVSQVLKAPYFKFMITEGEIIILKNPFCSQRKPTDDEILEFKLNLKNLLFRAYGSTFIRAALGNNSPVYLRLPQDSISAVDHFFTQFLTISDGTRVDAICAPLLPKSPKPPTRVSQPKLLKRQIINPKLRASIQRLINTPIPKPQLKKHAEPATTESLFALAASQYQQLSSSFRARVPFPIFESSYDNLENGRNLLLNYIDDLTTVWDEHPINLGFAIKYCVEFSNAGIDISPDQKVKVRLFFDKLRSVSDNIDIALYLSNQVALQRILSQRLDGLMNIPNPTREQKLEINLAKAELANRFGYGIVPTAGGKNGAVFLKTLEGTPVGVFKAPIKLGVIDGLEHTFKSLFGQARLLNNAPLAREYSEVVASDLCRELHFGPLVPEAIMAEFKVRKHSKMGAYIIFLDEYQELAKLKDIFNQRKKFTDAELKKWQMMVVWNFLIGNLDPHDENIFVKVNDQNVIEDIRMIDHGNCFPIDNPGFLGAKGNLGAWGSYTISEENFLPDVCSFITDNIKEDVISDFIVTDQKRKDFFTHKMKHLLLRRTCLLRKYLPAGHIKTPKVLAGIITDGDYASFAEQS